MVSSVVSECVLTVDTKIAVSHCMAAELYGYGIVLMYCYMFT